MPTRPPDAAAGLPDAVLAAFGLRRVSGGEPQPLGGGQSGDLLWAVTVSAGADAAPRRVVARRSHEPADVRTRDWLRACDHPAAGVRVAVPLAGPDDAASVALDGGHWSIEPFLSGRSLQELIGDAPTEADRDLLADACDALRRFHEFAAPSAAARSGPSSTVRDRIDVCDRMLRTTADRRLLAVRAMLVELADETWPQQRVWKDLWAAHVLVDERDRRDADALRFGLIDPGPHCLDHVAVDLSRLLGSLPWVDRAAIRQRVPLSDREWHLCDVLESSGLVLSYLRWQTRPESFMKRLRLAQIGARLDGG